MSNFVVINGQRLAFDDDGDYEDTYDLDVETIARTKANERDTEERRQYNEYCQSMYDKHANDLQQEQEHHEERIETTKRRQRYGDDYEGELDDRGGGEEGGGGESEFTKKCRNAATASATENTDSLLPISEFGQDAEWYVERESTVEKEKEYVHVLNPQQRDFESLLAPGESIRPETCFACSYLSNPLANQLYVDQWQKIVVFWQHGVVDVNMSWSSLGMGMYKVFTETIVATMVKTQKISKDSIVWSPYGMLYHFRYHCIDDMVNVMINLRELNYTVDIIRNNELYLRHPASGRMIVSKEALAKMKQVTEIRTALSKPIHASMSTSSGSSSSSSSTSVLAGKGSALLKKPHLMTTMDLINRPNYTSQYSRHL